MKNSSSMLESDINKWNNIKILISIFAYVYKNQKYLEKH